MDEGARYLESQLLSDPISSGKLYRAQAKTRYNPSYLEWKEEKEALQSLIYLMKIVIIVLRKCRMVYIKFYNKHELKETYSIFSRRTVLMT